MRVKLVAMRKAMRLTQAKAAENLDVSRSHYSQIESGDKTPSLDVALRIKRFFNYQNDDIFLNTHDPKKAR